MSRDGTTPDSRTTVAWYRVYLVLTVVSALTVTLARFDVPPFDALSSVGVAALVVGLFAAASLGYWYDVRRWKRETADEPPDFLVTLDERIEYLEDESEREADEEGREADDEENESEK